jgi:PilZ domain
MFSRTRSEATLSGEINLRRDHLDADAHALERRSKPRLRNPFPATVTGIDQAGRAFQLQGELANMSSSGLYFRMAHGVNVGEELNFSIKFSNGISNGATARVVARVVRVERGADGLNGFGMAIMNYEFV